MANPLKTNGLRELAAFKQRVRRQRALGRITQVDHDELIELIESIETRVVEMEEEGGDESWQ